MTVELHERVGHSDPEKIFPALILLDASFGRGVERGVILFVGFISLAVALFLVHSDPQAAFDLLPSRFWELMLGAILALRIVTPPRARWLNKVLPVVGLGLAVREYQ